MTLGFVVLVTRVTEVSIFAMSLVSMLGLGLGIDYSLFVVSRFRDELAEHDVPDALGIAMATAGKAVLFSGLTVLHRAARPDDVHVQRAALARDRRLDRRGALGAGGADVPAGDPGSGRAADRRADHLADAALDEPGSGTGSPTG